MLSLWQDVRFGIRTLVRSSTFSIASVATIALGIGAATAIVTVFDAVLLRPLPYPDADRLVVVWETIERADVERRSVSYPDYLDWRDEGRSFGSLEAFSSESFTLGGDESVRVAGEAASAGYFSLLGRLLQLGREFAPDEDRPDGAPVVIIGHDLWRSRFAGQRDVIGRELQVDEQTATVIGVAPEGFGGLADEARLWVPFAGRLTPRQRGFRDNRATRWHQVVGRLATGVTPEDAQADLEVIAARLAHTFPDSNADRSVEVVPLREELFGQMRPALVALARAVAFLLLIACSNVANLLLARGASRRRELAVRAALGAGRGRLARQLITEAVCLALVGGVAGLAIAAWSLDVLGRISPLELPSWVSLSIDARALFGSFLVTLMTGVAIGALPALGAAVADPQEGLRAGRPRGRRAPLCAAALGPRRGRARRRARAARRRRADVQEPGSPGAPGHGFRGLATAGAANRAAGFPLHRRGRRDPRAAPARGSRQPAGSGRRGARFGRPSRRLFERGARAHRRPLRHDPGKMVSASTGTASARLGFGRLASPCFGAGISTCATRGCCLRPAPP